MTDDVPAGTLHWPVARLPEVVVGDPVRVTPIELQVGELVLARPTRYWQPPVPQPLAQQPPVPQPPVRQPTAETADASAQSLLAELVTELVGELVGNSSSALWPRAPFSVGELGESLRRNGIEAVAGRLAGLGPGMTPSGDDVLAGLLLALALQGDDAARLARVAETARTHDISRAFLRWAARGQSIEPAHRLFAAVHSDYGTAARDAWRQLEKVGHGSGRELGLGVLIGLRVGPGKAAE